jgi:hypothetical protein
MMRDLLSLDNRGYAETLFALVSQAIKKVMKMDAADPFNVPVDPVALEIPVSILCYTLRFLSFEIHHNSSSVKHVLLVQCGTSARENHPAKLPQEGN